MIFESHAHYDDPAFDKDRDELLSSMKENGIEYIVNIGAGIKETLDTIELTKKYDFIYGSAGIHPSELNGLSQDDFKVIEDAVKEEKIVAVGEAGLDYHYKDFEKKKQFEWFLKHIDLARRSSLPLIVHSRDASKDTIDIMNAEKTGEIGGVVHCYSYSKETARDYLNLGFYLGIGGVITFKNAKALKEVVDYMPLDRILVETDCPYLAPEPYRGKRNSSLLLKYIIKEIANIKNVSEKEVENVTYENARKMYGI